MTCVQGEKRGQEGSKGGSDPAGPVHPQPAGLAAPEQAASPGTPRQPQLKHDCQWPSPRIGGAAGQGPVAKQQALGLGRQSPSVGRRAGRPRGGVDPPLRQACSCFAGGTSAESLSQLEAMKLIKVTKCHLATPYKYSREGRCVGVWLLHG